MWGNAVLRYARIALVITALSACATASIQPSETVTTLTPDAERWFKISWEAVPEPGGTVRLQGFIENTYGAAAANVQLLAQALDASGKVIGQTLQWLPGTIPGFGRVSYQIPGLPRADHYRVTVWSYERIESDERILIPR